LGRKAWPMRAGNERSDYAPFKRSEDGVGYVYVLGSFDGTRVKVGWSLKMTPHRLKQHLQGDAFGFGGNYTTLALVRGSRADEDAVHKYFAAHLVAKKEVYDAAPLVPYITWLRDQYFVGTNWEEFQSCQVMDAQIWLPGPGKESERRSEASLLSMCDPWAVLPTRVITGDDYYTPEHFLACVRDALGGEIDLDPASHVMANTKVKAKRFFTKDQNGLAQTWGGRVYLNPPFSSWPLWVDKVLSEVDSGRVKSIVMLGATRTLTAQYFAPLLHRSLAMCIISGRTPFWGMLTDSDSPTDGHFLLYIGPDVPKFSRAVTSLGATWPKADVAAEIEMPEEATA
jgi:hypothetical protein